MTATNRVTPMIAGVVETEDGGHAIGAQSWVVEDLLNEEHPDEGVGERQAKNGEHWRQGVL